MKLLERQTRGVARLPRSGRVFLDHARLALLQVDAATDGAAGGTTKDDRICNGVFGWAGGHVATPLIGESARKRRRSKSRCAVIRLPDDQAGLMGFGHQWKSTLP